jgi:oxygen-dependent protoporphyrinogen oxidase
MKRIVIVGGGISGLSIAWAVRRLDPNANVVLLERSNSPGGHAQTIEDAGYLCETGPDGFLDNAPDTLRLVDELGLGSRLLRSNDAARNRFIFFKGRLHPAPTSAGSFLGSRLLTTGGKARLLCEPFARAADRDVDETIHRFAERRIGREAADVLIDAMVSGVFAGDAHALSLRAALPRMWALERTHGSLFAALIATRRARRKEDVPGSPAGTLTSFISGMGELTAALARQLGARVRTGESASCLVPPGETRTWRVTSTTGNHHATTVILAEPSHHAAELVSSFDPFLASELAAIPAAPVAVVCLGYDRSVAGELNGFGFLAPRSQGLQILGALWESSIYPGRAPAGKVLLRVIIGGAHNPHAVEATDAVLVQQVSDDLRRSMGLSAAPEFTRIVRHRRGLPQYNLGHTARLHRIEQLCARHPGLYLAGNSYRGVSLNACITDAARVAAAVITGEGAPGDPVPQGGTLDVQERGRSRLVTIGNP